MLTLVTFLTPLYDCPAVVLLLHVHAHPHTNETSEGNCALGQVIGDLWRSVKKRKADSGRRTLQLFTAVAFFALYQWLYCNIFLVPPLIYLQPGQAQLCIFYQLILRLHYTLILNIWKYDPKKLSKNFKFVFVILVTGPSLYFYILLCISFGWLSKCACYVFTINSQREVNQQGRSKNICTIKKLKRSERK